MAAALGLPLLLLFLLSLSLRKPPVSVRWLCRTCVLFNSEKAQTDCSRNHSSDQISTGENQFDVNNQRAGEIGVEYESFVNDFKALQPTRSSVTNQDDFDMVWPDPLSLTHYKWHYPAELAPGVISNVFRAYWSMSMVWGLMAEYSVQEGFKYDAIVLARPDVWFHFDVDLPRRSFPLPERTVFVPSFDAAKLTDVRRNDRFAYGSMTAMRVAMNRLPTLLDPGAGSFEGIIDSEYVFGHHLLRNNITVCLLDLIVSRFRLTGDIPKPDHKLVKEACKSGKDPMACEFLDAGFMFHIDSGGT